MKEKDTLEKQPLDKNRWVILFVLVLCPFMATLDSSIINVALPVMADELGVSSGAITWVVSSYLIAASAGILFSGRLGDIIGNAKVLTWGMVIFTIGSLLCGLSASFHFLIASRAVQALGAAGMMANNQGIITRVFPKEEIGKAMGVNAAFVALGTLVGPALGGLILSFATWEYMFWINVPIGIAVCCACFRVFPKIEETAGEKMDYLGAGLFALTIIPLFIALGQGQSLGFANPFILFCLALAAVMFVFFLLVQNVSASPLLPLSIFRNKWFTVSIFCAFTSYAAISSSNIVLPFYLQDFLEFSPGLAGIFMTIYPLVLVLAAPVSGYLSDKIGSEILTLIGLLLTGLGLVLVSTLDGQTSYVRIGVYISLMALGNGMFQSPNNSLVMSSVPKDKLGVGGSVNALVRNIGYSFGVAVSTALLYAGMSAKLGYHVTDYVPGQEESFLYGMRLAYLAAAAVCIAGAMVTALRLFGRKAEKRKAG